MANWTMTAEDTFVLLLLAAFALMLLITFASQLSALWRRAILRFGIFELLLVVVGFLQWRVLARTDDALHLAAGAQRAAADTADRMRSILQNEQRAWVSCPLIIEDDLTYDVNGGAHFTFGCIFNNTGHSPAQKVFFNAVVFPNPSFDFRLEQTRVCRDAERANFGSDVFPGEPVEGGVGTTLSATTISAVRKSYHNNGALLIPYVVTCIAYKIIGDDNFHHTPRIYMLSRVDNRTINVDDGTVPKSQLSWKIFLMYQSAAD